LELTSGDLYEGPEGRRRPQPLWQVPLFFLGLFALTSVLAAHPLWQPSEFQLLARDLATIRRALQQSAGEAEAVQSLAENALARSEELPDLAGESQFLLANVYLKLADSQKEPRQSQLRRRALYHLEKASTFGVPDGDLPRCLFLMGKLILDTGGDRKRAIELLTLSLPRGSPDAGAGFALLVQAHLAEPNPDVDAALRANLEQINYGQDEETVAPARLLRAELLLKKHQRADAFRILERVSVTAPPGIRLKARSLLAEGLEQDGQWLRAVNTWHEVLKETPQAGRARVLYHVGMCHLNTEPPDLPLATAAWQDIGPDGGEEAQGSALLLAELHLRKGEIDGALPDLERALDRVKSPEDYQNTLVPIERVRQLFELGQRLCLESRQYDRGGPLMHLYRQVAEPGVAEERLGVIFETWGNALRGEPRPTQPAEAAAQEKQVRSLFGQAGAAFKEVADVNPQESEALWRSGNCFFYAQRYKEAAEVLARFLRTGKAGDREAEAWFALGEAHQAQNELEASRKAYLNCLQFDGSPFAARACYQLAVQAIAQSRPDEAQEILTQSMNMAAANGAEREVRRKALFKLSELLYERRQYDKAEYHLTVALSEFPNHPKAIQLRDHLGDSRRHLAWRLAVQERDALGGARTYLRKERLSKLEEAVLVYESLADELRSRESALTEAEKNLLRKARYAVADCNFERELLLSALDKYADCAQNYPGTKEGLLAYAKMMDCYLSPRLSAAERAEATATVRAVFHLTASRFQDIPSNTFPYPDDTWTKRHWQDLLSGHSRELNLPPPSWQTRHD
jgi:tetratricopeptide (TPR) repeat protein